MSVNSVSDAPVSIGYATEGGTRDYSLRFSSLPKDAYRRFDSLTVSTIGLGTYLGQANQAVDQSYKSAIVDALKLGVNYIDTSINYRGQRSERVVGAALRLAFCEGLLSRQNVVVATKVGYVAGDHEPGGGPSLVQDLMRRNVINGSEIVGGNHVLSASFAADQLARSLSNLGLACVDLYYIHNPEVQLRELGWTRFRLRLRSFLDWAREEVGTGRIRRIGIASWDGLTAPPESDGHLPLTPIKDEFESRGLKLAAVLTPLNLAWQEAAANLCQSVDGKVVSLLDASVLLRIPVFAAAPLVQGRLTESLPDAVREALPGFDSDWQRLIQFARSAPGVTSAVVGMARSAHVKENLEVLMRPPLSRREFREFLP